MDEIENFIKSLNNVNLDEEYAYERIILMLQMANIHTYTYTIQKNQRVFRSRENENIDSFNSAKELACPPKECVHKFSRVNRPLQSIFYCADERATSYCEFMESWVEKPIGTISNITIGRWIVLKELKVIILQSREKLGDDSNAIKRNEWDHSDILLNNYLVNAFSKSAYKNKSHYILTSAIANTLLLRSEYDGIMYPCVPRNGIGFNVAFKSEVYEKGKLRLEVACRESFKTVKKYDECKADHSSFQIIDGKIKNNGQTIDW